LFGGIYLNYLRHAQYSHLIAAENIADSLSGQKYYVETVDFNMDGSEEVIVSSPQIKALLSPAYGGSLMELDYRPKCFNLSNVVKRREEQYHKTLRENARQDGEGDGQPQSIHDRIKFKEADLENHLFFDRWERYSFLDRFLGGDVSLETFKRGQFEETGDFVDTPYLVEEAPAWSSDPLRIPLKRRGSILQDGHERAIEIEKVYHFNQATADVQVDYRISNLEKEPLNLWWGVEFNFTLLAGDAEDRYYTCPEGVLGERRLNSQGVVEGVQSIGLRDDWNKFELLLSSNTPATLWRYPVETVSQSESGFERTYQGSCIFFHWQFVLPAKGSRLQTFHLKIIQ
jgi:alpha-amylase